jgi:hypothetical protein
MKDKNPTEPHQDEDIAAPAPQADTKTSADSLKPGKASRFKQLLRTRKGKVVAGIVLLVAVVAILLAIPVTRYGILGSVIKKDVRVVVIDTTTKRAVSEASVELGSVSGKTDAEGVVTLQRVPVGEYTLKVTKSYFETIEQAYTVPVFTPPKEATVEAVATGRQVKAVLTNTITGDMLRGATLTVEDTSAVSDEKGVVAIVLSADQTTIPGKVSLDGYNTADVEVTVTEDNDANAFSLTPSGHVYYLSKQTGKINVMRSNLDGSEPTVVVEGTGNESDHETVLLAARDWKYLALLANRSGGKNKQVHLIDTATGKLTLIDEGEVDFRLIGWSGHKFLYSLNASKNAWESRQQRLKSFDAEAGKLAVLDETEAVGSNPYDAQYEYIASPYILEGKLVYAKYWVSLYSRPFEGKKAAIMAIDTATGQKQRVREFEAERSVYVEGKLYEPQEVYFRVVIDGASTPAFFEYEGGSVKSVSNTDQRFHETFYPTYLVSPSGQRTFWHEPRDGKNALFIGDNNGKNSTELALRSEYTAYGWYTDEYILLSKGGSELFIASRHKPIEDGRLVKISDYHKPNLTFPGYGYGYGGQ